MLFNVLSLSFDVLLNLKDRADVLFAGSKSITFSD